MVEAKLRVEITENREENNPFYGNSLIKNVVETTIYRDKDERQKIAPSGFKGTLKTDDGIMDITINRYYLDDANDCVQYCYNAVFSVGQKVYELRLYFNNKGEINIFSLAEWYELAYFNNGDDENKIYYSTDFVTFSTYLG